MRIAAALLVVVVTLVVADRAHGIDYPVKGNLARFRDPGPVSKRRFAFRTVKATNVSSATIGDPIANGASLRVYGAGAGDGDTGVLVLPAANWVALATGGYYYRDQAALAGGITQVRIRPGSLGGSIHVSAHGGNWAYAITQPQSAIRVQLTIGSDTFCARFTDLQPNFTTRIQAKNNPPPPDCS